MLDTLLCTMLDILHLIYKVFLRYCIDQYFCSILYYDLLYFIIIWYWYTSSLRPY